VVEQAAHHSKMPLITDDELNKIMDTGRPGEMFGLQMTLNQQPIEAVDESQNISKQKIDKDRPQFPGHDVHHDKSGAYMYKSPYAKASKTTRQEVSQKSKEVSQQQASQKQPSIAQKSLLDEPAGMSGPQMTSNQQPIEAVDESRNISKQKLDKGRPQFPGHDVHHDKSGAYMYKSPKAKASKATGPVVSQKSKEASQQQASQKQPYSAQKSLPDALTGMSGTQITPNQPTGPPESLTNPEQKKRHKTIESTKESKTLDKQHVAKDRPQFPGHDVHHDKSGAYMYKSPKVSKPKDPVDSNRLKQVVSQQQSIPNESYNALQSQSRDLSSMPDSQITFNQPSSQHESLTTPEQINLILEEQEIPKEDRQQFPGHDVHQEKSGMYMYTSPKAKKSIETLDSPMSKKPASQQQSVPNSDELSSMTEPQITVNQPSRQQESLGSPEQVDLILDAQTSFKENSLQFPGHDVHHEKSGMYMYTSPKASKPMEPVDSQKSKHPASQQQSVPNESYNALQSQSRDLSSMPDSQITVNQTGRQQESLRSPEQGTLILDEQQIVKEDNVQFPGHDVHHDKSGVYMYTTSYKARNPMYSVDFQKSKQSDSQQQSVPNESYNALQSQSHDLSSMPDSQITVNQPCRQQESLRSPEQITLILDEQQIFKQDSLQYPGHDVHHEKSGMYMYTSPKARNPMEPVDSQKSKQPASQHQSVPNESYNAKMALSDELSSMTESRITVNQPSRQQESLKSLEQVDLILDEQTSFKENSLQFPGHDVHHEKSGMYMYTSPKTSKPVEPVDSQKSKQPASQQQSVPNESYNALQSQSCDLSSMPDSQITVYQPCRQQESLESPEQVTLILDEQQIFKEDSLHFPGHDVHHDKSGVYMYTTSHMARKPMESLDFQKSKQSDCQQQSVPNKSYNAQMQLSDELVSMTYSEITAIPLSSQQESLTTTEQVNLILADQAISKEDSLQFPGHDVHHDKSGMYMYTSHRSRKPMEPVASLKSDSQQQLTPNESYNAQKSNELVSMLDSQISFYQPPRQQESLTSTEHVSLTSAEKTISKEDSLQFPGHEVYHDKSGMYMYKSPKASKPMEPLDSPKSKQPASQQQSIPNESYNAHKQLSEELASMTYSQLSRNHAHSQHESLTTHEQINFILEEQTISKEDSLQFPGHDIHHDKSGMYMYTSHRARKPMEPVDSRKSEQRASHQQSVPNESYNAQKSNELVNMPDLQIFFYQPPRQQESLTSTEHVSLTLAEKTISKEDSLQFSGHDVHHDKSDMYMYKSPKVRKPMEPVDSRKTEQPANQQQSVPKESYNAQKQLSEELASMTDSQMTLNQPSSQQESMTTPGQVKRKQIIEASHILAVQEVTNDRTEFPGHDVHLDKSGVYMNTSPRANKTTDPEDYHNSEQRVSQQSILNKSCNAQNPLSYELSRTTYSQMTLNQPPSQQESLISPEQAKRKQTIEAKEAIPVSAEQKVHKDRSEFPGHGVHHDKVGVYMYTSPRARKPTDVDSQKSIESSNQKKSIPHESFDAQKSVSNSLAGISDSRTPEQPSSQHESLTFSGQGSLIFTEQTIQIDRPQYPGHGVHHDKVGVYMYTSPRASKTTQPEEPEDFQKVKEPTIQQKFIPNESFNAQKSLSDNLASIPDSQITSKQSYSHQESLTTPGQLNLILAKQKDPIDSPQFPGHGVHHDKVGVYMYTSPRTSKTTNLDSQKSKESANQQKPKGSQKSKEPASQQKYIPYESFNAQKALSDDLDGMPDSQTTPNQPNSHQESLTSSGQASLILTEQSVPIDRPQYPGHGVHHDKVGMYMYTSPRASKTTEPEDFQNSKEPARQQKSIPNESLNAQKSKSDELAVILDSQITVSQPSSHQKSLTTYGQRSLILAKQKVTIDRPQYPGHGVHHDKVGVYMYTSPRARKTTEPEDCEKSKQRANEQELIPNESYNAYHSQKSLSRDLDSLLGSQETLFLQRPKQVDENRNLELSRAEKRIRQPEDVSEDINEKKLKSDDLHKGHKITETPHGVVYQYNYKDKAEHSQGAHEGDLP